LSGGLSGALEDSAVLKRFVRLSGGDQAQILVIAAGFSSPNLAQAAGERVAAALGVPAQTVVVTARGEALTLPDDVTGLLLIADDQSKVDVNKLQAVKAAWASGIPLLADDGGAAAVGQSFSAHGPTPPSADEAELAVQKSFIQGTTTITPGLGLLDISVEPQLLNDNRWGRLFSLAYNASEQVAFGLTQNTALEITSEGARTIGDNVVFALDLRSAVRDLGTNDGFVIANGLLDVFVPGDTVSPTVADVKAAPALVPTPILPTETPTPVPTVTPTNTPTPLPTATAVPTAAPTATPTAIPTATLVPTPIPFGTSTTGEVLPVLPITIGSALIFFVLVIVAGRRRK
jgi:cyanophycinase-like exopeptidase